MAELIHMVPSIEPKLANRFFVKYPKPFNIHRMATHKVSPLIYDCVKNEWKDITLELYDGYMIESQNTIKFSPESGDSEYNKNFRKTNKRYLKLEGESMISYEPVTNAVVKAFNKLKPKSSKKLTLIIEKLVATGQTVERWNVVGHIRSVDFGELDYSQDKLSNVKILFKVDKATLKLV